MTHYGRHKDVVAKKNLGQNFLTDKHWRQRIGEACSPTPDKHFIEVGPGTGCLTEELLQAGASVLALEKDERCLPVLHDLSQTYDNRLEMIAGDAMVYLKQLPADHKPCPLVGNLPYNIGTQIVIDALKQHGAFTQMVFLLQKEVVGRICAQPTDKDWGRLAIFCQLLADCYKLFDVPAGAFTPPPKITSSMVQLIPLAKPRYDVDIAKLERLTQRAFSQRRKMLRASLKGMLTESAIETAGIAPNRRPETLSLEEFVTLANLL